MENLGLDGARWRRLGARTRKGVPVVHIVSAGAWIGIDVVMAVLVFTALRSDDDNKVALCYRALKLFAVWPLIVTGPVPRQRRRPGFRHQVRPSTVLVGGDQADAEHSPRRAGRGCVATGGDRDGRAGPAVRGWRTGCAGGGRSGLPADRFDERPAQRDGPGRVQAVGPNP